MFPEPAFAWSNVLVAVATAGLLYSALIALVERDPRRIAIYVSLASLHLAIVGLFSLTGEGFEGAAAFLLTYGIAVAGLLFVVDRLAVEPAENGPVETSGLKPFSLIMLVGVAFGMGGLPGSGGFVSQLLVLLGSYSVHPVTSALATLGLGLLLIVLLRLVRRVSSIGTASSRVFRVDESVVLLVALVPTLWIGLYPEPVLRRLHPSILELCASVEAKVSSETLEKHGWKGCH
jgi:NADH-quinone oxidoreductase subunit M